VLVFAVDGPLFFGAVENFEPYKQK
jgi:hypothetical protein